jgi:outer membrane lipoprotein-sorting protein
MNKSHLFHVFAACSLSILMMANAAATAAPDQLGADQIVSKNVEARGGLAAWKRVNAMTMSGQIDAGKARTDGGQFATPETDRKLAKAKARAEMLKSISKGGTTVDKTIRLPFQMELMRPLKSRFEIKFQGDTAVQVFDGQNGWKLRPYLGRREVEQYTPEEMKIAAQQQDLDGFLIDYAAKGTKVELAGMEKVEGSDAYNLKLTLKDGQERHVWVDAKTFLDVKIDGAPRRMNGKLRPVVTYLRDYKSVNGLMIPHVLETSVEGINGSEKIAIEKVAVNPKLDDSRFTKPM